MAIISTVSKLELELSEFLKNYNWLDIMEDAYTSFLETKKASIYDKMVILYNHNENVREAWDFDGSCAYRRNRFTRRAEEQTLRTLTQALNDKYHLNRAEYVQCANTPIENTSGLYFIGQTAFNPYTNEKLFWVKVGLASNLNDRMNGYSTHAPMLWKIDFKYMPTKSKNEIAIEEDWYHTILENISYGRAYDSHEWFRVLEEMYLDMCEQGFAFFEM